jgi:AhpD family alkylhydroperoxidase
MARVPPLPRDQVPELEGSFGPVEQRMGFLPNSLLTMARRPEVLRAAASLAQAARTGTVSPELKELVALVSSTASGCRYCQAHTASNATRTGADAEKIAQV